MLWIICSKDTLKEEFLSIKKIVATDFELAFGVLGMVTKGNYELHLYTLHRPQSAQISGKENFGITLSKFPSMYSLIDFYIVYV